MKIGLGTIIFGLAMIVAAGAASAGMSDADCGSLDIHVVGAAADGAVECRRGDTGGGDNGKATEELIQVRAARSLLVILHARAGVRTYINSTKVKDMIQSFTVFDSTADWGGMQSSHKFTVQPFRGVFGGSSTTMPCFGFSRHIGRVSGTTGYRHGLWGFYCDFLGEEVETGRIDELLGDVALDYD